MAKAKNTPPAYKLLHSNEWLRPGDRAEMRIEVWRSSVGIVSEMYANGHLIMSTGSKRPYTLGQHCDGTIDDCVHALFLDYCETKGLSPQKLLKRAYPDERFAYGDIHFRNRIKTRARAEGVLIPASWGPKEKNGLIESLHEINYHSLATVLEDF